MDNKIIVGTSSMCQLNKDITEFSDPDIISSEGDDLEEFPLGYVLAIETTTGANWRQLGHEILSRSSDGRRLTMRFSVPAGLELNKRYVVTYLHTQLDDETGAPITFRGRSKAFSIRPANAVDGNPGYRPASKRHVEDRPAAPDRVAYVRDGSGHAFFHAAPPAQ